jgi:type I restriction enzyme S subunit
MNQAIKDKVDSIKKGNVPDGYIKSDFGINPLEWEVNKLGNYISDMKSGLSRKLSDTDIGIPVIRSNNIINNVIDFTDIKYWYLNDPQGANTENYYLKDGDILVNFINSLSQIGKTAMVYNKINRDIIFTTNILKMTLNKKLSSNYFIYFSQTEKYTSYISSITKPAVNQASFTTVEFKKMNLAVPPLPEQQKIADILSTWDKAIELKEQLIKEKKQQKKGLTKNLLTGEVRLPGFEGKWETDRIGDISKLSVMKNTEDKEIRVFSCTKYDGLVDSLEYFGRQMFSENTQKYKVVKFGEICYATNHIEEGSIGIMDKDDIGLVSPMYTVFKIGSKNNNRFVFKVLKSDGYVELYKTLMSASVNRRGSLRWNEFSKIEIYLPSYKEQTEIANFLDLCDHELMLYEKELDTLKLQKKGLMQLLLTGIVRVRC